MIGAIIGGLIGFIIGNAISAPKFKYAGKHYGDFKRRKGCFGGILISLLLGAVEAVLGALLSGE